MKKGISIASLGIVLIILSIITGIVVINSNEYVNETKKTKFVTEYMLVQTAVQKYYGNFQEYPIQKQNSVDSTIVLSAADEADVAQFGDKFNEALVGLELKVIDVSLLGYDDLTIGLGNDEKDFYGVDNDGLLYYIKGVRYNDKIYYLVTNELI